MKILYAIFYILLMTILTIILIVVGTIWNIFQFITDFILNIFLYVEEKRDEIEKINDEIRGIKPFKERKRNGDN